MSGATPDYIESDLWAVCITRMEGHRVEVEISATDRPAALASVIVHESELREALGELAALLAFTAAKYAPKVRQ